MALSATKKLVEVFKGKTVNNVIWNVIVRIILVAIFFYWEFQRPGEIRTFVPSVRLWREHYSLPLKDDTVSDSTLIMVSTIVPIIIFGVLSLWLNQSNQSIVAQQYKFVMSLTIVYAVNGAFTDFLKNSVGALRPDFLSRCFGWDEYELIAHLTNGSYTESFPGVTPICRNSSNPDIAKLVRSGHRSFPSGHASISFATFGYMALRLYGTLRLSPVIRHHGIAISLREVLHSLIIPICLLPAILISLTRYTDNRHHPIDIVCGASIGMIIAFIVDSSDRYFMSKPHENEEEDSSGPSVSSSDSFNDNIERRPFYSI